MTSFPHPERYQQMHYRRSGRSGLKLPAVSLGLWHNFGDSTRVDTSRVPRRAILAVSCARIFTDCAMSC